MTTVMQERARLSFELWDDLIAISLTESVNNTSANVTFNYSSQTSSNGTYADWSGYYAGSDYGISRAYIWLNSNWSTHNQDSDLYFGGYGVSTYLHEIGHTLGLSHPGTYNAGQGALSYANSAEYFQDTRKYTLMSYWDADDAEPSVDHTGQSGAWMYAATPLLHDIAAAQAAYGADMTTRAGNTVYGFNSNAGRDVFDFTTNLNPIIAIWDAGGTDTLDGSGYSTGQFIDLTPGSFSNMGYMTDNVAIAFGATIENAVGGSGSDKLQGNSASNILTGGSGYDTYAFSTSGWGSDLIIDADFIGRIVFTGVSNISVIASQFLGSLSGSDYVLTYQPLGAQISFQGMQSLASWEFAYTASSFSAAATWTTVTLSSLLNNQPMNLVGTGAADSLMGSSANDTLTGLGGSDSLTSLDGNDYLDGGAGADTMMGGLGDDIYFVDNAADSVIEAAAAGSDTVYSLAHITMSANVEYLVLQGGADLQVYSNSLANAIYGNTGANILDGGAGGDALYGGAGNDFYYVENISDLIIEYANEGADSVFSTANLALGANVEYLNLQGSADLQGYGNSLVNVIYGNTGANILDGGAGGDALYGGAGNDFYYVDNISDLILENANQGTDTVFATINYAIAVNVETLNLQGNADLQGYGNGEVNGIYGNAGNNLINGGGGADTLQGYGGNDIFVFKPGEADGDIIVDFTGNGAAAGDGLQFVGFGAGATFTQIDGANWQIDYNGGASHETITFNNMAAIHASDYGFV